MKEVNKIIKNIPNYSFVLSAFLSVWILYQFLILAKLNKLVFFSWWQVVNDSVSLFFPTLLGILWIIIWLYIKINEKRWFTLYFLWMWIIAITFYIVLRVTDIDMLYNAFWVGFLSAFSWKCIIAFNILLGSEKMKSKDHRFLLEITYFILAIVFLFNYFISNQYKDIYINENEVKQKVVYFNDKYIITWNWVTKNNENIKFIFSSDEQ